MEIFVPASKEHIARERRIAKELRASSWWKQRVATGVCYYCEQKFVSAKLTMDHKVAVARGGFSKKANIVVSCKDCNNKKKYLSPLEMILSGADPYQSNPALKDSDF